jgi:hypothetical protein
MAMLFPNRAGDWFLRDGNDCEPLNFGVRKIPKAKNTWSRKNPPEKFCIAASNNARLTFDL